MCIRDSHIIGNEFIRVFEEEAEKLGQIDWLTQGTLYPDVIESATSSKEAAAAKIKTHHNVGGLPDDITFRLIEPLRYLCLLYTSPSPRDRTRSRMPSSA